jgi:hypothetical protein
MAKVQRLVGDDLADLVVVPVRPSPADLWRLAAPWSSCAAPANRSPP